jgi:hypothetical protein
MVQREKPASPPAKELAKGWRRALSLLILLHVTAVFIAPFTFASAPRPGASVPSPVAASLMSWLHPYVEAMFLDHGYAFFAPDPGPSHLFRVQLNYADGRPSEELVFPDLKRHRPRLLYHRHFMLSERLIVGYVPSSAPPGASEDIEAVMEWRRTRERYETYYHTLRESYLAHLKHQYGAESANLVRVEHGLLLPDLVARERRRIDEREGYIDHPDDVPAENVAPQNGTPESSVPVRRGLMNSTRERIGPGGAP